MENKINSCLERARYGSHQAYLLLQWLCASVWGASCLTRAQLLQTAFTLQLDKVNVPYEKPFWCLHNDYFGGFLSLWHKSKKCHCGLFSFIRKNFYIKCIVHIQANRYNLARTFYCCCLLQKINLSINLLCFILRT